MMNSTQQLQQSLKSEDSSNDQLKALLAEKERRRKTKRYRADPVAFAREVLKFNPDPWQADVLRAGDRDMLLNCSRQSGKSTVVAALAMHRAQLTPDQLILLIAPAQRQSLNLFKKIKIFLKGQNARDRPKTEKDQAEGFVLTNGSEVVVLPGDDPDKVRSFSAANMVLLDEAAFCREAVYAAVTPMLATTQGTFIQMSTPNGRQGQFYDDWKAEGDDYLRFKITADQCPRISKAYLGKQLRRYGKRRYEQEYFCKFNDALDQIFTSEDIARAMVEGVEPLFEGQSGLLSDDVTPLF